MLPLSIGLGGLTLPAIFVNLTFTGGSPAPGNCDVRGRPDAGVTIVEYGDFACLFCG
jgi:hypothetical protein